MYMMVISSALALCAGAAGAAALQIPLLSSHKQAPIQVADEPKPLVNSSALQDLISGDRLMVRAKKMFEIAKLGEDEYNHPTRVIGSAGHLGTLSYIYETILQLGDYYSISNQSFPAVSGNVFESRLVLGNEVPKSAAPMGLTPPTKDKQPVYGALVLVENEGCQPSDFPDTVGGNIAFIKRGTCPFGTKSENAGLKGAAAAVVYNYDKDPVAGTLGTPSPNHVATFGLSGAEAAPIIKKLEKNEYVDAIAYMDAEVNQILTANIIAQTTEGDPDNCVMLGAHSDSVAEGPGINDDGSGTMSLLEVATQLTKFNVSNCVRFAWWAGEEEGLLGSDYYVATLPEEENMKIRLFMDYDMMASPNFAYQVYNATNAVNPNGSEELRDLYLDWYKEQVLNYTFIPFDGRSDYDGFIRNGIPGGGIATGAEGIKTEEEEEMFGGKAGDWYDPCYHQLCDNLGNLNMTAWVVNTKLIAHSVATYARSFKGFPKRTASVASAAYENEIKYHGSKLFI
ncbi:aminopeptidase-like protein Y [Trematosphaeria pertusa]|uniref:Peptide hydrolase n=1 Tax=Trematosphaeria pertusa TaxID=390896 RepID=A0A6A6HXY1_9PLEO|nr:aminopeptidase-like protein Y [Trematosphaeria pertusa]KAF2243074.1 aminopeptidase-like protein Y [Trematosphaeria pertusa]